MKARERGPDNRADFAPVRVTLDGDVWSVDREAGGAPEFGLKGQPRKAFVALRDLIEAAPVNGHFVGHEGKDWIKLDRWRRKCDHLLTDGQDEARRKAFKRAKDVLIDAGAIVVDGDLVRVARS